MIEPTITCPNCRTEIKLTESLAAPLLPKGVETFEMVEGIWITHPRAALPVAAISRQSLLEISLARQSSWR